MSFSFGIYWKQLGFFLTMFALLGGGFWYVNTKQTSEASPRTVALQNGKLSRVDIVIANGGEVEVNGLNTDQKIEFLANNDRLDYQVYSEGGVFIDELVTHVTWPSVVTQTSQITARHFGDLGVQTPEPTTTPQSATFNATNISPKASYSIEVVLPKGAISEPSGFDIVKNLQIIPTSAWINASAILPIGTLIFLLIMFFKTRRGWTRLDSKKLRSDPPTKIAPAVTSVLLRGRVSARSIAATLVDLAERGYIKIFKKGETYAFGKNRPLDLQMNLSVVNRDLKDFEKIILNKIFTKGETTSTQADIELRLGHHVFSRKVAESYVDIYDEAVKQGWFVGNPEKFYQHYKLIALLIVLTSSAGFVLSLFFGPGDNLIYLAGWASAFFVGIMMYHIIPFMPKRTNSGNRAYIEWLEFKNYLTSSEKISSQDNLKSRELYEQYLPYAIAFGVEVEWTERFLSLPFNSPDWYTSEQQIKVIEQFANTLFPIIAQVAYGLAKSREPYAI